MLSTNLLIIQTANNSLSTGLANPISLVTYLSPARKLYTASIDIAIN